MELKSNALTTRPSWLKLRLYHFRANMLNISVGIAVKIPTIFIRPDPDSNPHRMTTRLSGAWRFNRLATRAIKSGAIGMFEFCRFYKFLTKKVSTRSGDRTHADIRPLELKSNALTTRPSWCVKRMEYVLEYILGSFSDF